jgi:Mn-containing catalase
MFFHRQELQFKASPAKPDAILARRLQEVIGGQYGEITVAMQYGFQAWNAHEPGKYRDLLYGIGAEEFGHVEMLAIMVAQLLEKAPIEQSEEAVKGDPVLAAVIGGSDIQAAIVAGAGVRPVDSMGNPWSGSYITASGNMLADFTANANAEINKEQRDVAYQYINFSDGEHASEGSWASGPTPDGKGEFSYVAEPPAGVPMPPPTVPDERFYGTTKIPNIVEKTAGVIKDTFSDK